MRLLARFDPEFARIAPTRFSCYSPTNKHPETYMGHGLAIWPLVLFVGERFEADYSVPAGTIGA